MNICQSDGEVSASLIRGLKESLGDVLERTEQSPRVVEVGPNGFVELRKNLGPKLLLATFRANGHGKAYTLSNFDHLLSGSQEDYMAALVETKRILEALGYRKTDR